MSSLWWVNPICLHSLIDSDHTHVSWTENQSLSPKMKLPTSFDPLFYVECLLDVYIGSCTLKLEVGPQIFYPATIRVATLARMTSAFYWFMVACAGRVTPETRYGQSAREPLRARRLPSFCNRHAISSGNVLELQAGTLWYRPGAKNLTPWRMPDQRPSTWFCGRSMHV